MNLESEELNMEKIPEWIYAPTNFSPELEKTFAAVEKALGFKLFIWQKTFIANTTYRRKNHGGNITGFIECIKTALRLHQTSNGPHGAVL